MITLYDLGPSKIPGIEGFSPYVRSIIYTLKFKGIPFKISLVNWATLAPTAKSIGTPPTATHPDGTPKYTVPFLQDTSTGKSISLADSFNIAEYLDEAYPETPRVIPVGTRALQAVFRDVVTQIATGLYPVIIPYTARNLASPEVLESFQRVYPDTQVPVLTPDEAEAVWKKGENSFDGIAKGYQEGQVLVMGDKPIFVDFVLAGFIWVAMVAFGKESDNWKRLSGFMGGRLRQLMEYMEKYE